MKYVLKALSGMILALLFVITAAASDMDKQKKEEKEKAPPRKTTQKKTQKENNPPIYKPPLRGAPAGRVAGGTRGMDQEIPYLCLIVPEHIGLTISPQPVLYFYQSQLSPFPIEFTLIRKQGITPVVETRIDPPKKPGIQSVRLADFGAHLETGILYKWFIALVPDPMHRSKDILAAGGIELIPKPEKIKDRLSQAQASEIPYIYAESGLWYDAFHSLSSQIEKSPDDMDLKSHRASLLEQIGLEQVTGQKITDN